MASYPNGNNGSNGAAATLPVPDVLPVALPAAPASPFEEGNWDQIQAEARAAEMLPKYWGTSSSAAAWNPGLLKERYDAHQQAMERVALFLNGLAWWAGFGGLLLGFLIGMGGMITQQDTGRSTGDWGFQHVVFIMLFCGGLAYAMGWAARRLRWYNTAYGDAMALEYMDQASPWKITHIGLTKLVRLAFIAEDEDYYFGSTEESGIDRGMMLLKADAHTGGLRGMPMRRLFGLPAGGGGFTGTSSRALQALVDNSEDLAETKRRIRRKGHKPVGEMAFYVLLIVMAILTFMQFGSGFQVDPSAIDPAGVGESLLGGGNQQ